MNYFGIVSLFNGIVAMWVGGYVLFKDRGNQLHISFSIFTMLVALWSIFYSIWQFQNSKVWAFFFMRLLMAPCYYIPFAFLWFTLTLLEIEEKKRYLPLCLALPSFFLLFNFSELDIKDVVPRLSFPYWPVPGLLMHVYVIVFFIVLFYTFYLLFRSWFQSTGMRRWQLRWVTVTMLLTWSGGSTNWFLWYGIPIPPFPNFFVGVFLLLLAYAIMRRQLFDIDTLADMIQEAKLSTLGIFAAGLLHEIRTPLCIAKGHAESLLIGNPSPGFLNPSFSEERGGKVREKLEKIINQINRISDIAERFLDLAKPHSGDRKLESIHLAEIVDRVLSFTSHGLRVDEIKFDKELRPDSVLHADRRDLEEILLNLVTNACQAMARKGGVLRIVDDQSKDCLRIHISDTGEGIPSDHIKRIFEPFFTTKKEKGTGLGLYIVKKLVERNGGKIKVESNRGRGTTFTIDFPIVDMTREK